MSQKNNKQLEDVDQNQNFSDFPNTQNTLIVFFGNSKEEKEELEKKHKHALVLEESQLQNLNEGQKKNFSSIFILGSGKKTPEKLADLVSDLIDKNKKVKVEVIFETSCKLTEKQKEEYVKKLGETLKAKGIALSSISYKTEIPKLEEQQTSLENVNNDSENSEELNQILKNRNKELNDLKQKGKVTQMLQKKGQEKPAKFKINR